MIMYSVVDIAGINQISGADPHQRRGGDRRDGDRDGVPEGRGERPLVGATMFGFSHTDLPFWSKPPRCVVRRSVSAANF